MHLGFMHSSRGENPETEEVETVKKLVYMQIDIRKFHSPE